MMVRDSPRMPEGEGSGRRIGEVVAVETVQASHSLVKSLRIG